MHLPVRLLARPPAVVGPATRAAAHLLGHGDDAARAHPPGAEEMRGHAERVGDVVLGVTRDRGASRRADNSKRAVCGDVDFAVPVEVDVDTELRKKTGSIVGRWPKLRVRTSSGFLENGATVRSGNTCLR